MSDGELVTYHSSEWETYAIWHNSNWFGCTCIQMSVLYVFRCGKLERRGVVELSQMSINIAILFNKTHFKLTSAKLRTSYESYKVFNFSEPHRSDHMCGTAHEFCTWLILICAFLLIIVGVFLLVYVHGNSSCRHWHRPNRPIVPTITPGIVEAIASKRITKSPHNS